MATRRATWARACSRQSATCATELKGAVVGLDARRPACHRPADDRAGRHRQQGSPGRQCAAGRLAGRGAGRRRRREAAAVPTPGYAGQQAGAEAGDAGADDEHHQRRRARGQQPRRAGIHDPAGGCADPFRGAALRRRDLPHAEEDPARPGPGHVGGRRGRFRAQPDVQRGGAGQSSSRPSSSAGYKLGKDIYLGLDVASSEFYKDGKLPPGGRGTQLRLRRIRRIPGGPGVALSHHHDRRRHERRRLGRAGRC